MCRSAFRWLVAWHFKNRSRPWRTASGWCRSLPIPAMEEGRNLHYCRSQPWRTAALGISRHGASGDDNRRRVVAYETPRSIFLSFDVPLRPVRTNSNLGSQNRWSYKLGFTHHVIAVLFSFLSWVSNTSQAITRQTCHTGSSCKYLVQMLNDWAVSKFINQWIHTYKIIQCRKGSNDRRAWDFKASTASRRLRHHRRPPSSLDASWRTRSTCAFQCASSTTAKKIYIILLLLQRKYIL